MKVVYKYYLFFYLDKSNVLIFFVVFWPLKLCLREFAEQRLHCSITPRDKEQRLHKSAWQRTKAPWNCRANLTLFSAPRSYGVFFFAPWNHGAFVLCPVELWSNATSAPKTHRDTVPGAKYFFNHLRSIQPLWLLVRKKYIEGRYF